MAAETSELAQSLTLSGAIVVTETVNEARLAVAAQSGTKRVRFLALGDACPVCVALNGKVFLAGSEDAARLTPPLHINCRCIWGAVGDREAGAIDRYDPDDEMLQALVEQHAHFVNDADKYKELRVPAAPGGRDFVFRRHKDPETGDLVSEVEWRRPRYELDLPASPTTGQVPRQTGQIETGPRWQQVDLPSAKLSTAELRTWAQERHPEVAWSLSGDADALRPIVAEFHRLSQSWPEAARQVRAVSTGTVHDFAVARYDSTAQTITLSQPDFQHAGRLHQRLREDRATASLSGDGSLIEPVLTHEFGHHLLHLASETDDLVTVEAATRFMLAHREAPELGLSLGSVGGQQALAAGMDLAEEVWATACEGVYYRSGPAPEVVRALQELLTDWHQRLHPARTGS